MFHVKHRVSEAGSISDIIGDFQVPANPPWLHPKEFHFFSTLPWQEADDHSRRFSPGRPVDTGHKSQCFT
jgi:hypothetical protein